MQPIGSIKSREYVKRTLKCAGGKESEKSEWFILYESGNEYSICIIYIHNDK